MKKMFGFLLSCLVMQLAYGQDPHPIDPQAGIRYRENIKNALLEAKKILGNDNGRLWGVPIWNDSLLVI